MNINVKKSLPLQGVTVLLVEDEPDIADMFSIILQDAGATLIQAGEATEALELLKNHHPDVLLSNIQLPYENGDWLIEQIRASEVGHSLPAIAITSYTREVSERRMLDAGFQELIVKPGEPDKLIQSILDLTKVA